MLRLLSALRHPITSDTSVGTAITENEHFTETAVAVAIAVAVEVQNGVAKFLR